jgi:glutamyl-tRNA(Gln) amidotransferase subunit D
MKKVRVKWKGQILEGILLPSTSRNAKNILVLKLRNGYNIGIYAEECEIIEEIPEKKYELEKKEYKKDKLITIIGTGGTIASRVDYITGGVVSQFTVEDFLLSFPELKEIANYKLKQPFQTFSEDMTPEHWKILAETVYESLKESDGVVITHGTDTMHFTSSYLSFAIQNPGKPIILVGAQRSSDRPSSDAAYNLVGACLFAINDFSGVFVCMHKTTNDDILALHLGTKVRKLHTSRRDAFKSVNFPIVAEMNLNLSCGKIENYEIIRNIDEFRRENTCPKLINTFHENICLFKVYPGIKNVFKILSEYDGVIIEGTGLGHVPDYIIEDLKQLIESEIFIGMTSQCIFGRVHGDVYSKGVKLQQIGIVYLEDMLPETAYVKLGWVMGQTKDLKKVKELMLTPVFYEITERTLFL